MLFNYLFKFLFFSEYIFNSGYYYLSDRTHDNTKKVLQINNISYRESITYNELHFAKYFEQGNYNFNYLKLDNYKNIKINPIIKTIDGIILNNNCKLDRDIYISNKNKLICSLNYTCDYKHKINIMGNFQTTPQINSIYLEINNNRFTMKNIFYKSCILAKGTYTINIYSTSNKSFCICPSINKGFTDTKYLFSWIDNIKKDTNYYTSYYEKKNITESDYLLDYTISEPIFDLYKFRLFSF